MGQGEDYFDVLRLLELGHALDEAGQDAPAQFVRAAEERRREFGPYIPEPPYGRHLSLVIRLAGHLGQFLA